MMAFSGVFNSWVMAVRSSEEFEVKSVEVKNCFMSRNELLLKNFKNVAAEKLINVKKTN